MYEQAFRLTHHGTPEALEKQVKCYLASVNAFNLCDPKFAWVIKPADPDLEEEVIELPRKAGTESVFFSPSYHNSNYKNFPILGARNYKTDQTIGSYRFSGDKKRISLSNWQVKISKIQ